MRLSIASYLLLIITVCFLIQFQLVRMEEMTHSVKEESEAEEQAREFYELYENIWKDLVYFPVPESTENEEAVVAYENSWMFERTYGGSYGHEGTDLMAGIQKAGYYPVVSISDGVVEKIGWLEKGGWRIGIRSLHDVYFYYAHLSSYAEEFKEGDVIKAGQILGYMGDTGYGVKEGTSGKFDVHLHLGIYIRTEEIRELAVNPYWFLKYLEQSKLRCSY
ncbi:MAG: M23 family metallopeptidase [Lachnospiraceae bacterium]|jgi:murein DD-endopeptidase MepM/ murein hydrolase activator NlpD|uniref:M23 family metallopeptidase n=1 Tax=Candidatus Merdisoma sp. JLR.KK006 TaxID=3112626 RepID=UPI002FEFB6F7|nr:M23 family metallopeptidase [Lachnospiraceae bacterium]